MKFFTTSELLGEKNWVREKFFPKEEPDDQFRCVIKTNVVKMEMESVSVPWLGMGDGEHLIIENYPQIRQAIDTIDRLIAWIKFQDPGI